MQQSCDFLRQDHTCKEQALGLLVYLCSLVAVVDCAGPN